MGRKPNALIIQHFERGAKLPDSSNRYQHTCKACGEKFPKGRIDSLTTHLVKKCPALSIQDRKNALLQLNDLPNIENLTEEPHVDASLNRRTVELPVGTGNWTALETLAEVSRQFDISDKHGNRQVNSEATAGSCRSPESQRPDRLQVHEQYTLENPPVSYEQRLQREKKLHLNLPRGASEASFSPSNFSNHVGQTRSESPNLAMAAAAAARFIPSMVDPQLLGDDVNIQHNVQHNFQPNNHHNLTPQKTVEQALSEASASLSEALYNQNTGEQQFSWPAIVEGSVGSPYSDVQRLEHAIENAEVPKTTIYPRLPSLNAAPLTTEFSTEYGNGQKSHKPKVRGRFTASRRKEVQEVRKKGACIRCRMLKKPCSEGTPCNTCKSVESARLWKTPCIRTRVADELEMYSAGLHAVLARHEVNNAKGHVTFRPSPQQVDASHYPDTAIFATFNSLEGRSRSMEGNIDPGLNSSFNTNTLRILDYENDDLTTKLEDYTKRISGRFYELEPSKFMHITLSTAQELAATKSDHLLVRALELWSIVHILVDHEMTWNISERVEIDNQPGQGPTIEQNTNARTYNLLCLQLNAAAEKKAAIMSKNVLNELERRLLQRSANQSFETFLVAIITLNCIEKSTWLFKSWEQESFKYRWPLEKTPRSISLQGDKLTDMLQMLLRMRNVPPKTYTRPEDGILATDVSQIAYEYYKKLNLSYVDVLSKQANHQFDPADSRCYELRYCSRLLLPIT